jgi:nucleotide-binding universal stress UspA family protein
MLMDQPPFQSIVYPTDFSLSNAAAFAHAVRLAIAARSALHILHVDEAGAETERNRFPAVRELLTQWQMLEPDAPPDAVKLQLGVTLVKTALSSDDVAQTVGAYAEQHSCDLLVMLTHESSWMRRILKGSRAEATARLAHSPTLFLRDGEEGFVDGDTGKIRLTRVLMPIAAEVAPMHAWGLASNMVRMLEPIAQFHVLHVGETLPTFGNLLPHVDLRRGPVVETILEVADNIRPDLIVMATAGHNGLFDDLRGSTTERVLRDAPCPVLAIPWKQRRDRF